VTILVAVAIAMHRFTFLAMRLLAGSVSLRKHASSQFVKTLSLKTLTYRDLSPLEKTRISRDQRGIDTILSSEGIRSSTTEKHNIIANILRAVPRMNTQIVSLVALESLGVFFCYSREEPTRGLSCHLCRGIGRSRAA
jgi:hypothetical protein